MSDFKKRIDFYISKENFEMLLECQKKYSEETKIKFTLTDTLNRLIQDLYEKKCNDLK